MKSVCKCYPVVSRLCVGALLHTCAATTPEAVNRGY